MLVFIFTDIENSTSLWLRYRDQMGRALAQHDALLTKCIENHGGQIVKSLGDGFFVVFDEGQPLECALEIQRCLEKQDWGGIDELRVRIAIHAGPAERRGDDYFGEGVIMTERLVSAGWGGQILFTQEIAAAFPLPPGAQLQHHGVHLLKDLSRPIEVLGLTHPDLRLQSFPPLRSRSNYPNNLPTQPTPFVGRERELESLSKLLNDPACRILTLFGPGGIGKTRLALQLAAHNLECFPHGVYFVSLAELSSLSSIIPAIAEALHFNFYSRENAITQLQNYLREKKMLLLMDNFEHIVQGAGLVSDLLSHAPALKILTTSRERLNLHGESMFEVPGMPFPQDQNLSDLEGYAAVQLFLQSARRVNPNFTLLDEDKPYVYRIIRTVGGLPLGIELATSWLRILSCRDIAVEIEQSLDFLVSSTRDMPTRHQSLQAVFEYSWNLLTDAERQAVRRLAVFRSSFSRYAAEKVTQTNLLILANCVDKSLLHRAANGRYTMLETLQQCARKKLAEVPQEEELIYRLHSEFYSEFLAQRANILQSGKLQRAMAEISEEIENIHAAWNWAAVRGEAKILDQSLEALFIFYYTQSRFKEGEDAFHLAVSGLLQAGYKNTDLLVARLKGREGWFSFRLGMYAEGRKLLEENLEIALEHHATPETAFVLHRLAMMHHLLGNLDEAEALVEEALALYQGLENEVQIAFCQHLQGAIFTKKGEYNLSRQCLEESLQVFERYEHLQGKGLSLNMLGNIAFHSQNYLEAQSLFKQSLEICRELGDKHGISSALNNLSATADCLENYTETRQLLDESVAICREIGDRRSAAIRLNNMADLYHKGFQNDDESIRLYQECISIFKDLQDFRGTAYSLHDLALVHTDRKEFRQARQNFRESLKLTLRGQDQPMALYLLVGVAMLLDSEGQPEQARQLLLRILNDPQSSGETRERARTQFRNLGESKSVELEAKEAPIPLAELVEMLLAT